MKRFYLNASAFIALLLITVIGLDMLSMFGGTRIILAKLTDSTEYISDHTGSADIIPQIEKAMAKDGTTKLIIGDSVCRQLFNGLQDINSEDFTIIGSNAAITMAGQYILAAEYLKAHPNATDIYLFALPPSLKRTFDTELGYQYVIMPFAETDTLCNLDSGTISLLEGVYGKFFMKKNIVKAIDLSGINRKLFLNYLLDNAEGYEPASYFELADKYVCEIDRLCKENNVKFHFYPCPRIESSREAMEDIKGEFNNSAVSKINPEYMDMIYYFPDGKSEDGTHFSPEYATQEQLNTVITEMLNGNELLKSLKLR